MMNSDSSFEIIHKTLAVYSLLLLIVGTLGNIFTCVICCKKRLRSINTFVLIAFMTSSDTLTLYVWNLNHFLQPLFGISIETFSIHSCKFFVFLQFFSLEYSVWLLVAVTIERYLSIRLKNWRTSLFSPKKAIILAVVIGIVIFLINFHLFITNGYLERKNETEQLYCYKSVHFQLFPMWEQVHGYLYSFIPFLILLLTNCLLLHFTLVRKSNIIGPLFAQAAQAKQRSMTITIVLITVAFIVLTTPSAIAGAYFLDTLSSNMNGQIILFACDILTFSFHALNFIGLTFTNKQFRREFTRSFIKHSTSLNVEN